MSYPATCSSTSATARSRGTLQAQTPQLTISTYTPRATTHTHSVLQPTWASVEGGVEETAALAAAAAARTCGDMGGAAAGVASGDVADCRSACSPSPCGGCGASAGSAPGGVTSGRPLPVLLPPTPTGANWTASSAAASAATLAASACCSSMPRSACSRSASTSEFSRINSRWWEGDESENLLYNTAGVCVCRYLSL